MKGHFRGRQGHALAGNRACRLSLAVITLFSLVLVAAIMATQHQMPVVRTVSALDFDAAFNAVVAKEIVPIAGIKYDVNSRDLRATKELLPDQGAVTAVGQLRKWIAGVRNAITATVPDSGLTRGKCVGATSIAKVGPHEFRSAGGLRLDDLTLWRLHLRGYQVAGCGPALCGGCHGQTQVTSGVITKEIGPIRLGINSVSVTLDSVARMRDDEEGVTGSCYGILKAGLERHVNAGAILVHAVGSTANNDALNEGNLKKPMATTATELKGEKRNSVVPLAVAKHSGILHVAPTAFTFPS